MNPHRFTLQPPTGPIKKHTCPQCDTPKKFKRYIDAEGKVDFPDFVGRCERQVNCAYHYTPKQYFADYPDQKPGCATSVYSSNPKRMLSPHLPKPAPALRDAVPSVMSADIMQRSLSQYGRNNLMLYLCQLLGESTAHQLAALFQVGTSNHWRKQGATVFWQQDEQGRVRGGKIMLYDPTTGKRRKEDAFNPTWVHSVMKLPDFKLCQCLFGAHQLAARPLDAVAIVESEKTALIATAFSPRFIWLATGGLSNLNVDRCQVLSGRKVVLFPDLSADGSVLIKWSQKAKELAMIPGLRIRVSDYLENRASDEQKKDGLDLADFLLKRESETETPRQNNTWIKDGETIQGVPLPELAMSDYPAEWDLPNAPDAKPCISAKTFHEWQQQHEYFGLHGVASLTPQQP